MKPLKKKKPKLKIRPVPKLKPALKQKLKPKPKPKKKKPVAQPPAPPPVPPKPVKKKRRASKVQITHVGGVVPDDVEVRLNNRWYCVSSIRVSEYGSLFWRTPRLSGNCGPELWRPRRITRP